MNYNFISVSNNIKDTILKINNIDECSLDISDFVLDFDLDIIKGFKDYILALKDKRFLIIGDYDCDGICATVIIKKLLDDINIKNNYYIPSRFKQGYGISLDNVEMAKDNNFDVIIMVDNGSIAIEQISKAREYGIKTIVIDHHEYIDKPNCDYFVHSNLFSDKYADMCAAGLCSLLSNSFRYDELSVVYGGLATLADMVTVLNYNRYLVKQMYEILNNKDIYPLKLLLGANEINYTNIQFNIIPKINAISRLEYMLNVNFMVKYLLADENTCRSNFNKIDTVNDVRKLKTKDMYTLATRLIDASKDMIVVCSDKFEEGLCGLIANKIMNEYHKPVIVLAKVNNEYRGSGRSLSNFSIYNYLKPFEDKLITYGGHSQAIGLSINAHNISDLYAYIDSHSIDIKEESKDVILLDSNDINFDTLKQIEELSPYGTGFENVLLAINCKDIKKKYIVANKYPKYILSDLLQAISFNSSFKDLEFEYMIGHLKIDDYHVNKLTFLIEDIYNRDIV